MSDAIGNDAVPAPDLEPVPAGSLVVGHDGSDGADYALAQALELAERLRAPLVIVRAWSIASAPRPSTWEFGYVSSFDEYSSAVHEELVTDAGRVVEKHPTVSVDYRAVHADPATALIDLSRDARMLVVGSRGLGGFRGLVLGSVSERCVRHADCPVLVARPRHRSE
jgi:nucleotide-binding universal stress UspA family protein